MPRPKIPEEERKIRLNVRLKKKLIDDLNCKLKENETLSDLIERIILNYLKNS